MSQIENGNRNEIFRVPIPVSGEAFMIMNEERKHSEKRDAFKLFDKLVAKGILELVGFGHGSSVFECAKQIMDICSGLYTQDRIKPTDALISATALVDEECRKLYTADAILVANENKINEIGSDVVHNFQEVKFSQFS